MIKFIAENFLASRLMRCPIMLFLCLMLLTGCLSEEEKRLQTDQTYEGEEMFRLSYSLDEHVAYSFYPMEYYRDSTNQSTLPGCPTVVINELTSEVVLTFGQAECPTNRALRSGNLILHYPDNTLSVENHQVEIRYEDYWAKGIKMEGRRKLFETDTIATELILTDSIFDFVITDANRSTTQLNGIFKHELIIQNDTLLNYTTMGSGGGRNITGRPYAMEITQKKEFSVGCGQEGFAVAEIGQERWIFERTASPDVIHTVIYEQAEDCNHAVHIQLDDGKELIKKQQ